MKWLLITGLALGVGWVCPSTAQTGPEPGVERTLLIDQGPRNGEGDLVVLRDGRILLVYTRMEPAGRGDFRSAHLAGRYSTDGGRTWTAADHLVLPNEGRLNIMSVSLLRLADGRIGMFYVVKNSLVDCRPRVRFSSDEAATWSEAVELIPASEMGYYVLNNDRVIQLASGRLVVPVALHNTPEWTERTKTSDKWADLVPDEDDELGWTEYGHILCYLSDDAGATWRRGRTALTGERKEGPRIILQEPGVVELDDGRVMMWFRTDEGRQWMSFSEDGGETWSAIEPAPIVSPRSPAAIERIPATGDLLLIWNHNPKYRRPLNTAISRDEGATWASERILEPDPSNQYAYAGVLFTDEGQALIHFRRGQVQQINRVALDWLYGAPPEQAETKP